jgi:hypothetical protein
MAEEVGHWRGERTMKPGFRAILLVAMLWPAVSPHAGDATVEKRYRLPEHGYFQMNVPAAWNDELRQPSGVLPPTIAFRARQGAQFAFLVTPIWRARADVAAQTRDSIKQSVERAAERVKPHAVEKTINVVEFSGAAGPGFYFSVTDPAPKPGEYEFMTQGIVKVSDLVVTFTILINGDQLEITQDALAAIKSAVQIEPR